MNRWAYRGHIVCNGQSTPVTRWYRTRFTALNAIDQYCYKNGISVAAGTVYGSQHAETIMELNTGRAQ